MSDIFGGVQPPAWLTDLTIPKRQGQLGHTLGLALGGGILALQPDESGDGRKGLAQGLYEARLNEQDPNWKVKTKALEGAVVSNWARAATEWQSFDATNRDMAQWATEDLPALTKYQEELKTDPNAVPPVVQSDKGQKALQQIETGQLRKATLKFKQEQADNMLDIQQQRVDNASTAAKQEIEDVKYFNKTLPTVKSPADRARIRELQKQGKMTDAMTALEGAEKEAPVGVQVAEKRGEEQRKTDEAKAKGSSAKETAAIKNIEKINDWTEQAKAAEAEGDVETAKTLRNNASMLQDQMKGWGMTMGYDDQGRVTMMMGKGTQPTIGTQTMAQEKVLQYQNAEKQIDYLKNNLTSEHVGLRGVGGEMLIDRTAEQFFPGVINKGRVNVRDTIRDLRSQLIRKMSDDTARFTASDREEVGKMLPSDGVFESAERAKISLQRVSDILADRTKRYSRAMNVPAPSWTLNDTDKEEIVKRYQDGLKSKLDPSSEDFKKKGFLTHDEAANALMRSE